MLCYVGGPFDWMMIWATQMEKKCSKPTSNCYWDFESRSGIKNSFRHILSEKITHGKVVYALQQNTFKSCTEEQTKPVNKTIWVDTVCEWSKQQTSLSHAKFSANVVKSLWKDYPRVKGDSTKKLKNVCKLLNLFSCLFIHCNSLVSVVCFSVFLIFSGKEKFASI